jgi:hypothetical protein
MRSITASSYEVLEDSYRRSSREGTRSDADNQLPEKKSVKQEMLQRTFALYNNNQKRRDCQLRDSDVLSPSGQAH